jgi:hypothetical protein
LNLSFNPSKSEQKNILLLKARDVLLKIFSLFLKNKQP